MALRIVPIEEALEGAAGLLDARQRRARLAEPLLPEPQARAALDGALARPHARGVAAVVDGEPAAFLVGDWGPDGQRGRVAWVRLGGSALASGADPLLLARLYAELAAGWVERGCLEHLVLLPTADREAVEAWFALGFGQQQVHALRPVGDEPAPAPPEGLTVREGGPDDLEHALALADLIGRHQALAPVFGAYLPEADDGRRASWEEALGDAGYRYFLALRGERAVGHLLLYGPEDPGDDDLFTPAGAYELSIAATLPEERGAGAGVALTAAAAAHAAGHGATALFCDWRSTNPEAARFWPRRGFRPAVLRLSRLVDGRATWAR